MGLKKNWALVERFPRCHLWHRRECDINGKQLTKQCCFVWREQLFLWHGRGRGGGGGVPIRGAATKCQYRQTIDPCNCCQSVNELLGQDKRRGTQCQQSQSQSLSQSQSQVGQLNSCCLFFFCCALFTYHKRLCLCLCCLCCRPFQLSTFSTLICTIKNFQLAPGQPFQRQTVLARFTACAAGLSKHLRRRWQKAQQHNASVTIVRARGDRGRGVEGEFVFVVR